MKAQLLIKTAFGIKLRALRIRHKQTQEQVACDIGLTQSTYSRIEAGSVEPGLLTLYRIKELFGVSWGKLLP